MSGLGFVLQQIPLAVTLLPPSLVTFPPLDADVSVIFVIEFVDKDGIVFDVPIVVKLQVFDVAKIWSVAGLITSIFQ